MVNYNSIFPDASRRQFMKRAGGVMLGSCLPTCSSAILHAAPAKSGKNYETHAKGIRIFPGVWRPHYPWEHIAWISPSWPCQDYIWLDFPEAIFTSQGLLYLSHINPPVHTVYNSHPAIPWKTIKNGISFERLLPNGVRFGSLVTKGTETTVNLKIWIKNGSKKPLNRISLQTCAFLRGIKEFADYSVENKYVHIAKHGWVPVSSASKYPEAEGNYRVGWRWSGKQVADWPIMVTVSKEKDRLVAMTWFDSTLSLVSNPGHPCFHADPFFPDLKPGEEASIHGQLIFFEGRLQDFDFKNLKIPQSP
jgi:hypothetical protein